jgi:glycosyltransferase involved in cell wall biosynthesis
MTRSSPDAVGATLDADGIALPLVSVVIVNFNYGRFLGSLVDSIFAQTYANIECIAVDNASTDDSLQILAALAERHPVKIIARGQNDGQTPASLDGLAAAQGAYVIFVDADDLLLPRCVETHVYAHLSLRAHVGFTSGDEHRFEETARRLDGRIHLVPPMTTRWVWSPTSGSCYRRDALLMFADNPALAGLRTGTDMYFGHAIGALCGSALIDEPVFAYRIHGGNIYSQRAQLDRTLCFRPGGHGDSNDRARLVIIDQLVEKAERFAPNVWLKLNLFALLVLLDRGERDPALPRWRRRSRLAACLATNGAELGRTLGWPLTTALKLLSGLPLRWW